MATNLKQLTSHPDLLTGGHRACAGCTGSNILRQIMLTAGADTVVGGATGCMEVVTTIFPYTAWRTPFIHSAFENCAATISGVETAFRSLKKHGELPVQREKINFIAFGGDGPNPSEDQHIREIREAMDKTSAVSPLAAGLIRAKVGSLSRSRIWPQPRRMFGAVGISGTVVYLSGIQLILLPWPAATCRLWPI